MPLDGLSFNSGFKIITPQEVAAQAEMAAKVEASTSIKKTEKKEKANPDAEDESKDQKHDLQGRDSDDSDEEQELRDENGFNAEAIKKYRVKFNHLTEMVELIDQKTGYVVETLLPDDLVNLISKTRGSSGILVDKQI